MTYIKTKRSHYNKTYWLKCCSALGSKTTKVTADPGPILSKNTKENQLIQSIF